MTAAYEDLHPSRGSGTSDVGSVLSAVRQSTLRRERESRTVRAALWERSAGDLLRASDILVSSFRHGGKVLAFGNGGCSTAAMDVVHDLMRPVATSQRPLPALDLTCEGGVLTAVANDVGVERVFELQLLAHGREGDVAMGFCTNGESRNVLGAFECARELRLHTIGFAGYDGGGLVRDDMLDVVLVAPSEHAPRIQEAHATAWHALLAMVHRILGAASDDGGESSVEAA